MSYIPSFFRIILLGICSVLTAVYAHAEDSQKLNPTYFYLNKGTLVTGWELSVGDPEKWYTPISNYTGKSVSGKLNVAPADFRAKGDAVQFTWAPRKPVIASVTISGAAIDLSSVEESAGLVIDLKIDLMPDKDVALGMGCGDNCRGELHITKLLNNLKKGEWMSLPIPLSCLSKHGLNIKKVNAPLTITTEGKLTLSIANVRVEKLNEDEKACND